MRFSYRRGGDVIRYDVHVHGHGGGFVWEITRTEDDQKTHAKDGWEATAPKARKEAEGWVKNLQAKDARQPKGPAYTVRPFSGDNYDENAARCSDGQPPCAICGTPIKDVDNAHMAVVIEGGYAWGDENSDENEPGHMGGHLVGPGCHRKYKSKGGD